MNYYLNKSLVCVKQKSFSIFGFLMMIGTLGLGSCSQFLLLKVSGCNRRSAYWPNQEQPPKLFLEEAVVEGVSKYAPVSP